jgi:hypothetical protein
MSIGAASVISHYTISKVVEFRNHGIAKEYIDEMVKAGFRDLTPDLVVKMKINGI